MSKFKWNGDVSPNIGHLTEIKNSQNIIRNYSIKSVYERRHSRYLKKRIELNDALKTSGSRSRTFFVVNLQKVTWNNNPTPINKIIWRTHLREIREFVKKNVKPKKN